MQDLQDKLKLRFNKASQSYDKVATAQQISAQHLSEAILRYKDKEPKTILDAGAGTGYLTKILHESMPNTQYYLNDISPAMLDICQQKFSKLPFEYICQDVLDLDGDFDYIVSNMMLQWVPNLFLAIDKLRNMSKDILAFTCLLEGTFENWQALVNKYQEINFLQYPTQQQMIKYCSGAAVYYEMKSVNLKLDNTKAVLEYMQQLGVGTTSQIMSVPNIKKLLRYEKEIILNYNICIAIFKRG